MFYTHIRLTSLSTVDLRVVGATPSDQFICKGFDGLGPPEIDISIANTPHQGGVYQNSRPQLREIVVRIGLNPDWGSETPSDLRNYIYYLLTGGYTGSHVAIILLDDSGEDLLELCRTTGYIKKCEINPFSKDPEVQITFATTSPYFEDQVKYEVDLEAMGGGVIFDNTPTFTNIGSAPTGVYMKVKLEDYEFDDVVIRNAANTQRMAFDLTAVHDAGLTTEDGFLEFDTTPGRRYAQYYGVDNPVGPTYVVVNLLSAMARDFVWIQLHGGENNFVIDSDAGPGGSSYFGWQEISYYPRYWGV